MTTDERVLLMVGTTKGAFLFCSDPARERWEASGPHLLGNEVPALAYDDRGGRRRILAGARSFFWGVGVARSDDLGKTWVVPETPNAAFPQDAGAALERVWQIAPAGADEPDVVYAGVEPAALLRSTDGGETFSLVRGLWDHPHRPTWMPGNGGLCLHTIARDPRDPRSLLVALSTGGVYRSEDGGATWQASNAGIRADFLPEDQRYPEFGQCVHKVARDAAHPDTLYLQNHGGLYRSQDAGASWQEMQNGLPSDFGFPIVAHPRKPDTAYIIPLQADLSRWTPDGHCRVYRTQDGGQTWQPLGSGLPQDGAYLTVLRDGFGSDDFDPAGLYFGTRSGKLYGSRDEGESWSLLADNLPPILCVKAARVA